MHLSMVTLERAVIGCGYGVPQRITALHKVTIYSLTGLWKEKEKTTFTKVLQKLD